MFPAADCNQLIYDTFARAAVATTVPSDDVLFWLLGLARSCARRRSRVRRWFSAHGLEVARSMERAAHALTDWYVYVDGERLLQLFEQLDLQSQEVFRLLSCAEDLSAAQLARYLNTDLARATSLLDRIKSRITVVLSGGAA
jgi:hypothetical protein